MINSIYGKTMENLLINNEKFFLKYTSRPTHIHITHKILKLRDYS